MVAMYSTHLDVKFGPLERIDVPALVAACTDRWYNQTLCRVNDAVVRLGVVQVRIACVKGERMVVVAAGFLCAAGETLYATYPTGWWGTA